MHQQNHSKNKTTTTHGHLGTPHSYASLCYHPVFTFSYDAVTPNRPGLHQHTWRRPSLLHMNYDKKASG